MLSRERLDVPLGVEEQHHDFRHDAASEKDQRRVANRLGGDQRICFLEVILCQLHSISRTMFGPSSVTRNRLRTSRPSKT
jgi:hypothetical protein